MQSTDRTFSVAMRAFELMKSHCNSASPHSYEIWYTFVTGLNAKLNKAIKTTLAERGKLSCNDIEAFYSTHIASERLASEAERFAICVVDRINAVTGLMASAADSAGEYKRSLEKLIDGARSEQAGDQPHELIDSLIGATKQVTETNRRLEARIRQSRAEIDHLRASLDTVKLESMTDPLTGIANRRHFEAALAVAHEQALKRSEPLALILMDVDNFKQFNDRFGHVMGDQVLRLVVSAMRDVLRPGATLARFGGEEFVMIVPGLALEPAVSLAEDIRRSIETKELLKRSTGVSLGRVTISLGVVTLQADENANALLQRADRCLYAAKRAGRNRTISQRDLVKPALSQVA
jgi:diguanylate cyclase